MVLSLILMNLVDWDGGVDNGWLNSLLLDDWLNGLVDVVMDMLASNGGTFGCGVLSLSDSSGVLELGLFGSETFLNLIVVSMLDVAVLNSSELMGVLLWKDFTVLDRLNRSVVVILMNLTVDSSRCFFVAGLGYVLILNGWVDSLR